MGDGDEVDRSFRADFTGDGVSKLRHKVSEKLKEFMGDYTDDTLVEYVIVLLKNGRSKAEARNELNVFLGDDSDSFVSWLWDHLGSSLHLYVQSHDSPPNEAPQINPSSEDQVITSVPSQSNSVSNKVKSGKLPRSRHNREWRSLVRDEEAPAPFRSTAADEVQLDEKTHDKVNRAKQSTYQEVAEKKRNRPEELPHVKGGIASQVTTGAARRLLQFAFKEALATSRTPNSTSEPALKRLRSVVSTSAADSSVERGRRRLQSLACVPNAMSTAIKAVEEAAKDVAKSSSSRNVFDRLGLSTDVSHANNRLGEFDDPVIEDADYDVCKEISTQTRASLVQGRHYREYHGNMNMLETDTCMASDSASDNDGYDHVNISGGRVTGVSRTRTSVGHEGEDSLMVHYSVAKNRDQNNQKPREEQDQPATGVGTSSKILNISVNVNTWKPPHHQVQEEIQQVDYQRAVQNIEPQVDYRRAVQNIEPSLGKSSAWSMKGKTTDVSAANGNTKPAADIQKESQKIPSATQGLYATGRPTEDVDSRTIFVSNVHFAATKDSLSRHFNKFGEVLKVIILTDAATGQPKGSAYVEFMRKEAAENALSLDGTSFMSRILKVVKKSAAHQDTAPMMTWPRAVRGSPFAPTARFGRGFVPRGIHHGGAYKARPPIKAGARSLQWKREEAQATPSEVTNTTSNNSGIASQASLGVRSLTYVRTEQNTNGRSATSS